MPKGVSSIELQEDTPSSYLERGAVGDYRRRFTESVPVGSARIAALARNGALFVLFAPILPKADRQEFEACLRAFERWQWLATARREIKPSFARKHLRWRSAFQLCGERIVEADRSLAGGDR
jgi:hypothetical protein